MSKVSKIFRTAVTLAVGVVAGGIYEGIQQEKRLDEMEIENEKKSCFYRLLVEWLQLKQERRSLAEYFEFNGYRSVAIYGMRELGERLVEELKNTDIRVEYIVDKNVASIVSTLPKYTPDMELPKADVMVVTAIYYYSDIVEEMEKKVDFPIISLEDVVYAKR